MTDLQCQPAIALLDMKKLSATMLSRTLGGTAHVANQEPEKRGAGLTKERYRTTSCIVRGILHQFWAFELRG